jgi:predicted DNA-binding antitoxin AbrB/MazE fold protein
MTIQCTAIFEHGVLRPLTPPQLDEGEQVQLIIVPQSETDGKSPAEILAGIAALPVEGGGDPNTSRDHDRVLYGPKGAP